MKIKDCMCNKVCYVKPNNKVVEIAKIMSDNHVGCMPVCDNNNQIVGLVTDRDIILRCVACDKDVKTTPVSDVMTTNVCCCHPDDELYNAQKKMSELQIRRIPVVENSKVVGMLTIGDLYQNTNINSNEVSYTLQNICSDTKQNAE